MCLHAGGHDALQDLVDGFQEDDDGEVEGLGVRCFVWLGK